MKKIATLVLVACTFYASAQKVGRPDAYAKTITAEDLKKHLYIVASAEMEGRETGTEGQRKAAAYIETHFKALGLQPGAGAGYQQAYAIYQDTLLDARILINGKPFLLEKDFSVNTSSLQATLKLSEVVVLGGNASEQLKNTEVAGKVVLVTGAPSAVFNVLMKKNPAAILTVGTGFPKTVQRKGRQTINGYSKSINPMQFQISEDLAKAIAGAEYNMVKDSLTTTRLVQTDLLLEVRKNTIELPASNVLGLLSGTDLKDEYLVISAHYDHLGKRGDQIFYGADDDGSGTVGVLELAEAFARAKKDGNGPRRSILFLAFSGEEKGLWGSEYYSNHPVYPLDKTTADLNIDMIGRNDPDRKPDTLNYIYVVGDDKLSSELKPISESINKKYTNLQLDYKYNDPADKQRIYYRSDHYNFARKGVPIIFYYDGMLRPDYHKTSDTPDKINYALMQKRAQLVFYTSWEMANRAAMLKRDIPLNVPPGF